MTRRTLGLWFIAIALMSLATAASFAAMALAQSSGFLSVARPSRAHWRRRGIEREAGERIAGARGLRRPGNRTGRLTTDPGKTSFGGRE